jgi:pimeloyl-ACP methyl ester carboxylesterase
VVLTAQDHNYDTAQTPPEVHRRHLASEREWAQVQRADLPLSTRSRQILVPKSGHYIQLDQPQVVLAAIETAAAKAESQ